MQNEDGTWAGHHCITGRVAVTSAAILMLAVDREPAVRRRAKVMTRRDIGSRYCFWRTPAVCGPSGRPWRGPRQYLWSQQADDGGWHSHTYGLLRSGQSLTPFVLEALLEVPERVYPLPRAKVDRAIAFIRKNTRPDGALGMADPGIPDYPNYATALAVSALCRARRPGWEMQVRPMLAYLRAQQFTEQNGWDPADPVYGAWGMGGERRTPPDTGHVDLSMTRHVLEALRDAGVPDSDPVFERAFVFLERCQNLARRRRWRLLLFHHRVRHQQSRPRRQALPQLRHHHRRRHPGAASLAAPT